MMDPWERIMGVVGLFWSLCLSMSCALEKMEMKPTKLIPPPYVLIVGGLCWAAQPWTLPWRSFFQKTLPWRGKNTISWQPAGYFNSRDHFSFPVETTLLPGSPSQCPSVAESTRSFNKAVFLHWSSLFVWLFSVRFVSQSEALLSNFAFFLLIFHVH